MRRCTITITWQDPMSDNRLMEWEVETSTKRAHAALAELLEQMEDELDEMGY